MPRDLLDETLNIEFSRAQRQAWERTLLIVAGLHPGEADRIARLAAEDRAAIKDAVQGLAA